MSEIEDDSVDLIVTSPPYNIGTQYGDFKDLMTMDEYQTILKNVFSECNRILKKNGKIIVEAADSVFSNGTYMQLSGYIQHLLKNLGLNLFERHFNFALSQNGIEEPEHNWNIDYTTKINAHSNCHQIVVFVKGEVELNPQSKTMYFNYKSTPGHPCPTPMGVYNFILQRYFYKDMIVVDPFMGTAILGTEVIRNGGVFYGYERDDKIYKIAEDNLSK